MMKGTFRQQQRTLYLVERHRKVPISFNIANNGLELVFWLVEALKPKVLTFGVR